MHSCTHLALTTITWPHCYWRNGTRQPIVAVPRRTRVPCWGTVFTYDFVTNFPLSLTMKEFWKSVNIWRSYGQELCVLFFWLTVYFVVCYVIYDKRAMQPGKIIIRYCIWRTDNKANKNAEQKVTLLYSDRCWTSQRVLNVSKNFLIFFLQRFTFIAYGRWVICHIWCSDKRCNWVGPWTLVFVFVLSLLRCTKFM